MTKSLNRLAKETSLYLKQHADNPVDWYPWGEEALEKARRENKPILLSIGYAACHWCHVMAHESFSDNETAALMNHLFINIKVDREERPDLDKIYQTAHFFLTQQSGGWPLTLFLTPDLTPFFSGTYFPKEPRFHLPAFKQVLQTIAHIYEQQPSEVKLQNESLLKTLQQQQATELPGMVTLDQKPLELALDVMQQTFDSKFGGFNGPPKFPQAPKLELLLQIAPKMALQTLTHMANGGIYDQLGGGFYRYAVDGAWQIPHFEKMLYDNAVLLFIYVLAYQQSENPLFLRIAKETAQFAMTMQDKNGGFHASIAADSEGKEGKFYIWDQSSFKKPLTLEEQSIAADFFGLTKKPNFEGAWHLLASQAIDSSNEHILASAKAKLLTARENRPHPELDTKILTAWNSLMIKSMLYAGDQLQEPAFLAAGEKALSFIEKNLWYNDRLFALYANGKAKNNAYLDDYAYLIDALLTSLQIHWHTERLYLAIRLADELLAHFLDKNGGFYFTRDDQGKILYRPKTFMDEPIPAGNGIAAQVFLTLGYLLGNERYLETAEHILQAAWPYLLRSPAEHSSLLIALKEYLSPSKIIILRGEGKELEAWQKSTKQFAATQFAIPSDEINLPETLALRYPRKKPCAYVCEGRTCSAMIENLNELSNLFSHATRNIQASEDVKHE